MRHRRGQDVACGDKASSGGEREPDVQFYYYYHHFIMILDVQEDTQRPVDEDCVPSGNGRARGAEQQNADPQDSKNERERERKRGK